MSEKIVIIGALDTKGREFAFVKRMFEARGQRTLFIDTGVMGEPEYQPELSAAEVAEAGGSTLTDLRQREDRGQAIAVMTAGVVEIVHQLYEQGKVKGVFGMGGSAGTAIATSAMRALPVGLPKVMVSTLAAADTGPYVGIKDVVMFPSVVDVAGINRISARIYANAVGAMVGMVETAVPQIPEKPLVAASMFGNTTILVDRCRQILEDAGYEVLVFHATGTGGRTMEDLIASGYFSGSLDVTTTEWADELVGGELSAGPTRLDAAAAAGIPQVIAPGCVDMANFWARDKVPAEYDDRLFYEWNPNVTLMRTNLAENAEIGRILAEKGNASSGSVAFFLPLQGVSMLDAPGKEFWWPEANQALFEAIKKNVRPDIPVYELDNNINDADFAEAVTGKLLEFMEKSNPGDA
jgi:uncharacterized protein (UPF0261 family)